MQVTNAGMESVSMLGSAMERGRDILGMLVANKKLTVGLGIIVFFILVALLAPFLTPYNPSAFTSAVSLSPSFTHLLGTTRHGEDVFAQLVYGARISLLVGFCSAIGSTILQILFGLSAGYFGGLTDDVLSLIINVFLVLPGLPLAIVIASFAPIGSNVVLTLILLFTSWAYGARVLRAQTLSLRERDFVTSARSSGERAWRIVFSEIMPNEIALVASNFVTTFVYTVGAQVALEFLGLGDVTKSSWGVMLYWAQLDQTLLVGQWWRFIPPGLCVAVLCAGLTLVNFGIDELANPSLHHEKKAKTLVRASIRMLSITPQQKKEQVVS
ncbi:MAG TPA: ABC transporter permease [Ktedonobacteraceae bacterium]|jgi:peptide/nickel transport system permease protein